ncbi:transcriptional regulator SplA domain-containing protein [Salinibacillus xinjiangensis]|uniref:Transcriptional regulator n=1 Tax=Salinibacillus xinjiangensis TaxID=1229268 RepID=A0A6G1XB01_9BACI|nr:transcriptional regulator SplA domain-containing protein [Salinibacillus xinjiangensis]MRG88112.1 transcriptional regulator [Salinibacillus xinjiangensis]
MDQNFKPGEVVYMIIRNPHAQDVAHVQQAAIVENPDNPHELALFAHENYFPLSDEFALFKSEEEAEEAYKEAFGTLGVEDARFDG